MHARILPQTVYFVATGAVNSGKSHQFASLLTAEVDGDRFALPCLYIMAEASAEGTVGEVLLDPGACCVWPCASFDDALEALRACFPDSGPVTLGAAKQAAYEARAKQAAADKAPPPPRPVAHPNDALSLRSLVVDTASKLYQGSLQVTYRALLAEAGGKVGTKQGGREARYNDDRELHKGAAKRCADFTDRLNGVALHRGLFILVSCHTTAAMRKDGDDAVCFGEAPNLGSPKKLAAGVNIPAYSRSWDHLAASANIIWHCFETAMDHTGKSIAEVNARVEAEGDARFGVITQKGTYPDIGPVKWVKRQGGDGPLNIFAHAPPYWHARANIPEHIRQISETPNLGKMLAYAIQVYRRSLAAAAE